MNKIFVVFGEELCTDTNTMRTTIISIRNYEDEAQTDVDKWSSKSEFDDVYFESLPVGEEILHLC